MDEVHEVNDPKYADDGGGGGGRPNGRGGGTAGVVEVKVVDAVVFHRSYYLRDTSWFVLLVYTLTCNSLLGAFLGLSNGFTCVPDILTHRPSRK